MSLRPPERDAPAGDAPDTDPGTAPATGAGTPPDSGADDRWTRRARPGFLYVMYALLLWSIPVGMVAAIDPAAARAIGEGMRAYLAGIPEPLYALFGTGYVGYTVAREWGKGRTR